VGIPAFKIIGEPAELLFKIGPFKAGFSAHFAGSEEVCKVLSEGEPQGTGKVADGLGSDFGNLDRFHSVGDPEDKIQQGESLL
jgi:hypothetical protein